MFRRARAEIVAAQGGAHDRRHGAMRLPPQTTPICKHSLLALVVIPELAHLRCRPRRCAQVRKKSPLLVNVARMALPDRRLRPARTRRRENSPVWASICSLDFRDGLLGGRDVEHSRRVGDMGDLGIGRLGRLWAKAVPLSMPDGGHRRAPVEISMKGLLWPDAGTAPGPLADVSNAHWMAGEPKGFPQISRQRMCRCRNGFDCAWGRRCRENVRPGADRLALHRQLGLQAGEDRGRIEATASHAALALCTEAGNPSPGCRPRSRSHPIARRAPT